MWGWRHRYGGTGASLSEFEQRMLPSRRRFQLSAAGALLTGRSPAPPLFRAYAMQTQESDATICDGHPKIGPGATLGG